MDKINWGIIGCGDVTEVKSGPAFNKVSNSSLVAVMRRDGEKAKDYACRHNVPRWYTDANDLINDPEVNAVYISTPPSSHEAYTIAAIDAGKPVYVEKPMSLGYESALNMARYADAAGVKLTVAHYRRAQAPYLKIKQLLQQHAIGELRLINLELFKQPPGEDELQQASKAWRVNPLISGGGLFHDLAPHQLDLVFDFFGPVQKATGIAVSQAPPWQVDDMVTGSILFKNSILFNGIWSFNAAPGQERDCIEILGSEGTISFSVFEPRPVTLTTGGRKQDFHFDPLVHVQQPMIEKTVNYFLNKAPNPCSGWDGAEVMRLMEAFTKAN